MTLPAAPPRLCVSAREPGPCGQLVDSAGEHVPALRVAAFEPRSLVNGPGVRAVLWVQGCGRRCPGCFNPNFLPRDGGREVEVGEVLDWTAAAGASGLEPVEGVTFSGGEPFDQAPALAAVARGVRERGLGVVVFTGHSWADLRTGNGPGWQDLVAASDLLIAGPYEAGNPGTHPLLSSGNQELVHVTGRYREAVAWAGERRRVEFRIGGDGALRVSGLGRAGSQARPGLTGKGLAL